MEDEASATITQLAASVVAAYVENNPVSPAELGPMIASVYGALNTLRSQPVETVKVKSDKKTAAQIRASIHPDGIISFLNGQKFKTLRRHITSNGMTETEYKDRFGLPKTYSLVCAESSAIRSALAKASGLGNSRKAAPTSAKATRKVRPPKATDPAKEAVT
jgi:predicted transcriptional regulator